MLQSVIPIGNSKGIRLSKIILDKLSIKDKVEMEVMEDAIVLRPVKTYPREGWKEALSYTGLDLEKMLNSGNYVFVTEEDYNKKIKKITERNANLSKVDKKDINYSTYENINRRRL